MKKKRYTEEQIVRILQEADQLGNAAEIIRRENIGQSTVYKWKQKFGGLGLSEVRRLRNEKYFELISCWRHNSAALTPLLRSSWHYHSPLKIRVIHKARNLR